MTLASAAGGAVAADNPAEAIEAGRIDVIGTTPLPGLGMPLSHVPANVQVFTRDGRDRPQPLPDLLERNAASAVIASGQGNPYQPDFNYRGFTASPLLGLAQGLGVFQDGVRINEPFGDVVNWDLIPASAIASVQLIPGTTPVFGPNALGGTLAVYTKSGARFPGGSVEAYGGSFARRALQVEQGGSRGAWDYFVTANLARDRGWAEHNPSDVRQLFAKVGHQTDESDLDVSLTVADNRLQGNQALPVSFLGDIRQPYTWPDRNANRATMLAMKGSRFIADGVLLGATAYSRRYRNDSFSSNVNRDLDTPDAPQATNDRAVIDQRGYGLGVQLTVERALAGGTNQLVAGASLDSGDAGFTRFSQPARFTASRGTEALADFVQSTDADTSKRHYGAFVSDSFSAGEHWVLTLSGRHDRTRIAIDDRSGNDPALEGRHRFARFNPAAGVNFIASPALTLYTGYSEGMRAPTPVELTCADPLAPCKLPNNFLADPPLKAVVARTCEAGARGRWGEGGTWSAAAFRTELSDDIQFVSSGEAAANAGFFRNVGGTRRQGIELAAAGKWRRWQASVRYGLLDARFRAPFVEHSANNSSAVAGDIVVSPGDRIPGIPRHSLKVRVDYAPTDAWSLGFSARAASAVFARGDEDNRDEHGRVPGYAVLDLHAGWRLSARTEVFAFVDNALDARYASAGLLGLNVFAAPGHAYAPDAAVPEQFRGMGAPRGAWLGVRYRWD